MPTKVVLAKLSDSLTETTLNKKDIAGGKLLGLKRLMGVRGRIREGEAGNTLLAGGFRWRIHMM